MSSSKKLSKRSAGGTGRRAVAQATPFRTIGEAFYRLRAARGRESTLKQFASELGVDPVFLGYVEQGRRFPSEAVVERLAALTEQDPAALRTILLRDRMLRALDHEIRRGLAEDGFEATDQQPPSLVSSTKMLTRALAALPHEGAPIALAAFRKSIRTALTEEGAKATPGAVSRVVDALVAKGLMEFDGDQLRKTGRHIIAEGRDEQIELAVELSAIFSKGLADKLIGGADETYLRNHFVALPRAQVPAFRERLDQLLRELVDEFASDEGEADEFVRVLVTATTER